MRRQGMFFVICLLIFLINNSFASIPLPHSNPAYDSQNTWEYTLVPYLWAINLQGRVSVAEKTAHVEQSFGDLLKKLNFGGMIWLEARNDRFGAFINALYTVLSDDSKSVVDIHARNDFTILSGGLSYDIYRHYFGSCMSDQSAFIVAPYAGFRYTESDTEITVSLPIIQLKGKENQYWTDPIIGARLTYLLNKSWSAIVAGDIGGLNTSTQYSYNLMGLIGYHPRSLKLNTTFYLGYRLLDQRYQTGSGVNFFDWNMKISGPIVGVSITF